MALREDETKTMSPGGFGPEPGTPRGSGLPGPHLEPGTTVGRYVVLYRAGSGGMAVVYAAFDPELDRKVALKIQRSDLASSARRELPRREAQAMARLRHPNVVAVYDIGEEPAGTFLAMEYIDGQNLRQWLRETSRSWSEILEVFLQAGRGLAAAHAAGILHQDFKPSNVMVGSGGQARVTDFGLSLPGTPLIQGGTERSLLGTPAYLAPERYAGAEVDARSDQFSFCAAVYEALFGHLPFVREPEVHIDQVRSRRLLPPKPGHGVPSWVHRALVKGLSTEVELRFPTLDDLLAALSPAARRRRQRRLAAVVGLLLTGAAVAGYFGLRAPPIPPCGGAEARMEGVWDEERRQAVRKALAATQASFAHEILPWVEQRLDRYRAEWLAMHTEACEATYLRGEQSERMLDRRMLCLDDRLAELRAQTAELVRADTEAALHAGDAVANLRSVSVCGDRAELAQLTLPVLDAKERSEIEEARAVTEAQHARYQIGSRVDTSALESSLAVARRLAYPALEARALQLLSHIAAYREGDFDASIDFLYDALRAAMAGGDRVLQVALYAGLVELAGYDLNRLEESRRWMEFGEATLAALGPGHDEAEILLQRSAGRVALDVGELEEAQQRLKRSLDLGEGLWGPQDPRLAPTITNLAIAIDRGGGSRQEAIDLLIRAVELHETTFGSSNPRLAPPLASLAGTLAERGRYEEALEATARALEVEENFYGDEHWTLAYPEGLTGQILVAMDRPEEADPHLERARQLIGASLGDCHPFMATVVLALAEARFLERRYDDVAELAAAAIAIELPAKHNARTIHALILGRLHVDRGEFGRGEEWLRRALTLVEEPLPVPELVGLETSLGTALLEQGKLDEAAARFGAALELGEGRDPHLAAEARFGLARVLRRQGDPGAVAEARRAQAGLEAGSPRSRWLRRSVDRWLAAYDNRQVDFEPPNPATRASNSKARTG